MATPPLRRPLLLPSSLSPLLMPLLMMMLSSSSFSHAFSAQNKPAAAVDPAVTTATSDLAVVGCGVLGTSLCEQLLSHPHFAGRKITGVTKTASRHAAIREQVLGRNADDGDGDGDGGGGDAASGRFQVMTMEDVLAQYSGHSFKDVVFCAPPSGFDDYPKAVKDTAAQLWLGADSGGSFVFTSSGGVYEGLDGETVNESSPTIDPDANPRQGRMVYAEREAIATGGCALRLAGLYALERGAHNYWLEKCQETGIKGREDGIVNLLHYDDAASACLAALKVGPEVNSKQTFLISDGHPTTRRGICESAIKSERYATGYEIPRFIASEGDIAGMRGKVYDGTSSDEALGWRPRYASFDEFMSSS